MYIVTKEEVEQVKWEGNGLMYDTALYNLGGGRDEFIVVNPSINFYKNFESLMDQEYSTVLKYRNVWVAKYFKKNWTYTNRFLEIDLELSWQHNPDIGSDILFVQPVVEDLYDLNYNMTWYLDPTYSNGNKIWITKCHIKNIESFDEKDMGYITPDVHVRVIYNPDLPELKYDNNFNIAWHDFGYECIWYLDPKYSNGDKIWAAKAKLRGSGNKPTKDMGYVTPDVHVRVIHNPDLPELKYDNNFNLTYQEFGYECVWYLDPKYSNGDKIWAAKAKLRGSGNKPIKDMGYVTPKITYNPDLPDLKITIDDSISYYELLYTHVWMLDRSVADNVWAAKIIPKNSKGVKTVGIAQIDIPKKLDVVFISYNEPNAEKNWLRVLEKSPWAKRINGIKGIVNAHKCAAELATTDMFYVVDGDAYLADAWDFKFQPNIFDRDCVHVWRSQNPVNDLVYGYGGVKLIPRELMLAADESNTDMTTSVSDKFKVMAKVSNTSDFNTDAFNAWRSAFRECAKLAGSIMRRQLIRESKQRLDIWCTTGADRPFGDYAINGAMAGKAFGELYVGNQELLSLINDAEWLLSKFNQQ